MNLIDFEKLKEKLNSLFIGNSENQYLKELTRNFKKKIVEQENHPFKIVEIRNKGFVIQMYGLFGFLSFNHMAWYYKSFEAWKAVFPYLKNNIFFAKIHEFDEKKLSLIIDAKIAQFKKIEFYEDEIYQGVVIHKTTYGIFVDIGINFNWKGGSFVGMIHESNFEDREELECIETGEKLDIIFWGSNKKNQMIFGLNDYLKKWIIGDANKLLEKTLPIKIIKPNTKDIYYIVKGKYLANLPVKKNIYGNELKRVQKAIDRLKNEDIIHCKINKVSIIKKKIQLKWESANEIENIISRKNKTYLDVADDLEDALNEKLKLIGSNVLVKVIKKEFKNRKTRTSFLIKEQYKAKLKIEVKSLRLSKIDKDKIIDELKDGEIIECKVEKIFNDYISVKWMLEYKQMFNLLY